jgi:hypothetical protein
MDVRTEHSENLTIGQEPLQRRGFGKAAAEELPLLTEFFFKKKSLNLFIASWIFLRLLFQYFVIKTDETNFSFCKNRRKATPPVARCCENSSQSR